MVAAGWSVAGPGPGGPPGRPRRERGPEPVLRGRRGPPRGAKRAPASLSAPSSALPAGAALTPRAFAPPRAQSMYIRVKRKNTTMFLLVEPTDTILEVKQRIQDLSDNGPDLQRLIKGKEVLEDAKTLAEHKIENDDIVALVFKIGPAGYEDVEMWNVDGKEDLGATGASGEGEAAEGGEEAAPAD